jgi:ATP-dependent Clp protease, protease subunit
MSFQSLIVVSGINSMNRVNFKAFLLVMSTISISTSILIAYPGSVLGQNLNSDQRSELAQVPKPETASDTDADKPEDMGVDGWLLKERIVFVSGEIAPELAETVTSRLLYLDSQAPSKDIYLYINSSGGDITAGLAIYDTLKSLRSNVVTVCMGEASSMASILLVGGTKGKRLALPNSRIMIHQPSSYGVDGAASDVEIGAKEILYLRSLLNRLLSELTGQPLKRIEVDTDRDFFMSAQEAKAYGIVDRVVNQLPSASRPLPK